MKNIPDTVKRWGASITLGVMLGGLLSGALIKSGAWIIRVNDHIAWGQHRSDEVKEQFKEIDRKQDWMIHVLYRLAAKAGVLMPALPAGVSVETMRPKYPASGGLYAAEPDSCIDEPCRPEPLR